MADKIEPGKLEKARIEPKEAARKAAQYYLDVTGETPEAANLLIEELELSENKKQWHVTLSHRSKRTANPLFYGVGTDTRDLKEFVLDAITGEVLSMKVKKL